MTQKSLFITYLLWLFGGFFGLHQFYLGRDHHAFVLWITIGGHFGLGWLRDLWRIPEYVKDANEESSYMERLAILMHREPKPNTGTVRYFAMVTVSDAFGYLIYRAIPEEIVPEEFLTYLGVLLQPLAVAIGVYLVGNIGRHQGSFSSALIGAYLTAPAYFFVSSPVCLTSFASIGYFNSYSKSWRRQPRPRRSLSRRIATLALFLLIYYSLWASWAYFNCTMTSQDQEPVKCRDAAKHFFKSPIWQEFVNVMSEIWKTLQTHGWREVWRELIDAFDPVGEANALKVLGLNNSATQQDITSRYRQLSREWHPDKHKNAAEKQLAQEKFIEIQEAYQILSKIKSQRIAQNVKNPRTGEDVNKDEL